MEGGSANDYELASADPVNNSDGTGTVCIGIGPIHFHPCKGARKPDIKEFDDAIRACEAIIGYTLSKDQRRELHDAIDDEHYRYQEIVAECVAMFKRAPRASGSGPSSAGSHFVPPTDFVPIPVPV